MSYTQNDINKLRAMIAKGAVQMKQGEEQVTLRSLPEMRSLLAEMEAEVNGGSGRQLYPQFMERPL